MVSGNRPLVEVAHSVYIVKLRHLFTSCHSYANCLNLRCTVWYKSLLRRDGGNRSFVVTPNLVSISISLILHLRLLRYQYGHGVSRVCARREVTHRSCVQRHGKNEHQSLFGARQPTYEVVLLGLPARFDWRSRSVSVVLA